MRWLRPTRCRPSGTGSGPAGYDTHYQGKWHISHADLHDPATGRPLATNDDDGNVDTPAVAGLSRRRPARRLRLLGVGRARATRRGARPTAACAATR